MPYNAFISYSHAADNRLAPAIQKALQRFARPWYRLRALHVFRDKTSLAPTPELWGTIAKALQDSKYFVLLASPEAAQSHWVQQEIKHWLNTKSAMTLLIVMTGGEVEWDAEMTDFDWSKTTALPQLLRGAFRQEPLYVDLTWAKQEQHLSMSDGRFREAITLLAAAIHGRSPDEMAGEDIRQHRRTKMIATAAVLAILVSAVTAEIQRRIAVKERDTATAFLSRIQVSNALILTKSDDVLGALPWLAEVLKRDQRNEVRTYMHRVRLGMFLRSMPRLVQSWVNGLPINYAEFSPNGRWIVTAGGVSYPKQEKLGEARVWDAYSGQPVSPPMQHQGSVYFASFSPDGTRVVTASGDQSVRLWDARSGQKVCDPLPHSGVVRQALFSSDGHKLATATSRGGQVWNVESGEALTPPLVIPDKSAWYVAFDPSGEKVLVTYGSSYLESAGAARVWDAKSGVPLTPIIQGSGKWVYGGAFSPDGKRFVIADAGGNAQFYDSDTGQALGQAIKHTNRVACASFSPDGTLLLTASWDGTAHLRDLSAKSDQTIAHGGQIRHAAFSPDGGLIVTASTSGTARVWDARTGESVTPWLLISHAPYPTSNLFEPGETPGPEFSVAFASDGHRLVTTGWDGTVRIWDLATSDAKAITIPIESPPLANLVVSSPPRLKIKQTEPSLNIEDTQTGEQITLPLTRKGHMIEAIYSPDQRWLAVWENSILKQGWLFLVNTQTRALHELDLVHRGTINHVFFSPNSSRIGVVLGSNFFLTGHSIHDTDLSDVIEGHMRIWDIQSGRPVSPPFEASDWVGKAFFDAEGKRVVGSKGARLRIWDSTTGKPITSIMEHDKDINEIKFSPNGVYIATASQDGTARIWDAAKGLAVTPPLPNFGKENSLGPKGVTSIAFDTHGNILATGGADGSVRLWDVRTGEILSPVLALSSVVTEITFDSARQELIVTGADGTLRSWDISPIMGVADDLLIAITQALAMRTLDTTGKLVNISSREVSQNLAEARKRNSAFVQASEEQILLWHKSRLIQAARAPAQWHTALFHLDRVIEARQNETQWYTQRAKAYVKGRNFDSAVTDYSKAIQLGSNESHNWIGRANALIQLKRLTEAASDYRQAIDQGDTSHATLINHALLSLTVDDTEAYTAAAKQLLERASHDRGEGTAIRDRMLRSLAVGMYVDQNCRKLLAPLLETLNEEQRKNLPGAADRFCLGDYEYVQTYLKRFIDQNRHSNPAWEAFMLAITYCNVGDFAAAGHWLKQGKEWQATLEVTGYTKHDMDLSNLALFYPSIEMTPALELFVLQSKADRLVAAQ